MSYVFLGTAPLAPPSTAGGIVPLSPASYLTQGARGLEVYALQRQLNLAGAEPKLAEDSIFGPNTRSALEAFQAKHRVGTSTTGRSLPIPSGVLTPDTQAKLDEVAPLAKGAAGSSGSTSAAGDDMGWAATVIPAVLVLWWLVGRKRR